MFLGALNLSGKSQENCYISYIDVPTANFQECHLRRISFSKARSKVVDSRMKLQIYSQICVALA